MRSLTFRLVLCVLVVAQAHAAPVTYQQVLNQAKPQAQQPATDNKGVNGQTPQPTISESTDRPDFVRLADGRIVEYGPGVICSDACVPSEAAGPDDPSELRTAVAGVNPWLIAVPAIVGGIIACVVLCRGGDSSAVLTTVEPPRVVTPPNQTDVPEPATLILLGFGLAMMARHGFGKKKSDDQE
jgi:hypothetical protein